MDSVKVIAVGNPGSGKSTVLNSLAGVVLFKNGVNIGQGVSVTLPSTNKFISPLEMQYTQVSNNRPHTITIAGLTFQLDERENKNGHFLDTPGLADESLRKAAGQAISEGRLSFLAFMISAFDPRGSDLI